MRTLKWPVTIAGTILLVLTLLVSSVGSAQAQTPNCNSAFVLDVTIPDFVSPGIPGSNIFKPGDQVTKKLSMKNTGQACPWTAAFGVVWTGGSPVTVISSSVTPTTEGNTGEVSVTFTIPANATGVQKAYFRMKDASGAQFGASPYAQYLAAGRQVLVYWDEETARVYEKMLLLFREQNKNNTTMSQAQLDEYFYSRNVQLVDKTAELGPAVAGGFLFVMTRGSVESMLWNGSTLTVTNAASNAAPPFKFLLGAAAAIAGTFTAGMYLTTPEYQYKVEKMAAVAAAMTPETRILVPSFSPMAKVTHTAMTPESLAATLVTVVGAVEADGTFDTGGKQKRTTIALPYGNYATLSVTSGKGPNGNDDCYIFFAIGIYWPGQASGDGIFWRAISHAGKCLLSEVGDAVQYVKDWVGRIDSIGLNCVGAVVQATMGLGELLVTLRLDQMIDTIRKAAGR